MPGRVYEPVGDSVLGLCAVEAPFPHDKLLNACVGNYFREPPPPEFARHRRAGRSFPTDYAIMGEDETLAEHWNRVVSELDEYRARGLRIVSQSKQSVAADKRVFAGPSDADVRALRHIEAAWCVAEFMCAELGLRADTWTKAGLKLAHLRYGMMLDWLTRDVAARMARTRDGLAIDEGWKLYGLDPMRVAMEHGAVPDELDELAASTGLYERGTLAPFGHHKDSRYQHQWIDPETDPAYRIVVAVKERHGEELRRSQD
jgi:hypothetical protein